MMQPNALNRVAVVAHFDAEGRATPSFIFLLEQLAESCRKILVVSTSLDASEVPKIGDLAEVLVKPNLGYDFGSWSAGLNHLRQTVALSEIDEIVLCNNSFYVLRDGVLKKAFDDMRVNACDAWSLIGSYQMRQDVLCDAMSFFVVYRKRFIQSRDFYTFWSSIWEIGDRAFVIKNYELSIADDVRKNGFRFECYYVPRHPQRRNPTRAEWAWIAERVGIIKADIVKADTGFVDMGILANYAEKKYLADILDEKSKILSHENTSADLTPFDELRSFAHGSKAKIAVHIHLHYPELVHELMSAICNIPLPVDVFLTLNQKQMISWIVNQSKAYDQYSRVIILQNRGRDMLPFLTLLNENVFDGYEAVCKIHTKRSLYSKRGNEWRNFLVDSLLGSSSRFLNMLGTLRENPKLGLIGPKLSFVRDERHWGGNRNTVNRLAARMDKAYQSQNAPLAFFAGSMFWFRPKALAPIKALALSSEDFETEAGQQDGTLAHAVERLSCISAWAAGYEVTSIDRLAERLTPESEDIPYHIPVL